MRRTRFSLPIYAAAIFILATLFIATSHSDEKSRKQSLLFRLPGLSRVLKGVDRAVDATFDAILEEQIGPELEFERQIIAPIVNGEDCDIEDPRLLRWSLEPVRPDESEHLHMTMAIVTFWGTRQTIDPEDANLQKITPPKDGSGGVFTAYLVRPLAGRAPRASIQAIIEGKNKNAPTRCYYIEKHFEYRDKKWSLQSSSVKPH